MSIEGKAFRRWQLFVDCVIFAGITAICTFFIGGLGDCATAPDAAQIADCNALTGRKVIACIVVAGLVFPIWLRRKLRLGNDRQRTLADVRLIESISIMSVLADIKEQITVNMKTVEADPFFRDGSLWLTLYLTGEPSRLGQIADELSGKGWCNTEGWEYAFLYPKIEIVKELAPIVAIAEAMYGLCVSHGVEITNIDADTSPDVQQSKSFTLYYS